jgi:hypothetical protein
VTVDGPALSELSVKMCDRKFQDQRFGYRFTQLRQRRQGTPQIYFLPGEEGEQHDSFVERIARKNLRDLVPELSDERAAAPLLCRPHFPMDDTLASRQWFLLDEIYRSFQPRLKITEPANDTGAVIKQYPPLLNRFVVIRHNIPAVNWDPVTADLIRWYLKFWKGADDGCSSPQILVFLNVIYSPGQANPVLATLRRLASANYQSPVETIEQELEQLAKFSNDNFCPADVLPPLSCITRREIKDWFGDFGGGVALPRRSELMQTIFGSPGADDACSHMERVEEVLSGLLQ